MASDYALAVAFAIGLLLNPFLTSRLLTFIFGPRRHSKSSSVYALDQVKLNISLDDPSYWMNMGYWPTLPSQQSSTFPDACQRLLDEMLAFAGMDLNCEDATRNGLHRDTNRDMQRAAPQRQVEAEKTSRSIARPLKKRVRILDIGIGCGDQSIRLLTRPNLSVQPPAGSGHLIEDYIGVTNVKAQAEIASNRVARALDLDSTRTKKQRELRIRILCGDGARPEEWSVQLFDLWTQSPNDAENWLLGLDALYHLSPSRQRLLRYACRDLRANLAAFDLILASNATFVQRALLRVLCPLLGVPAGNICTEDAYIELLCQAGYSKTEIRLRDISAQVFPGITDFLEERDESLTVAGLGGLGRLRAAKWLFRWWARTGCVRGMLVAAKAPPMSGIDLEETSS